MTRPVLADRLGGDALAVTLRGTALAASAVGPVTITHGRADPAQPPDPATCTLSVLTSALPQLPQLGDPLTVDLGAGALDWLGRRRYADTVLDDAPLAYWRLGGDAVDSSGNAHHGTHVGTVTHPAGLLVDDRDPAAEYDGTSYTEAAVPAAGLAAGATAEVWVRVNGPDGGAFLHVGAANGWSIGIGDGTFDAPGRELVLLYPGVRWIGTGHALSDGVHHVAIVVDDAGGASAYADGALVYDEGAAPGSPPIAPSDVAYIGRNVGDEPGAPRAFAGVVDEAAVYERALTAADAQRHHARGIARTPELVRFTGHVTDVTARPALPGTPATVQVTATSRRARLGRTIIGDVPWPIEADGARARRILDLAAPEVGATVGVIDTGQVTVTARDVDRQPALDLLDTLARDSGGALVERRDGTLDWHDALHRQRSAIDVELTADQVLSSVESTQQLRGLVNELRVIYGPEVEGSERPSTVYTDPTSRADYGPFSASLGTQLQELADAEAFARLTVGRRSRPTWELHQLGVELTRTVPAATAAQLLQLEFADLVGLVGFPTSGPFAQARVWVEGWTETVTRDSWYLQLAVSDYGRNGPEPRWVDVNPDVTWADATDVTWLQAVGWDSGPAAQGRWVDVPADTSWSTFDPAVTWASA